MNKHRKLLVDDIRNLKQTNILQATFNTGHSQPIKTKNERCHRFLNDILAKGVQDKLHSEWEDVLSGALLAKRTLCK